VPIHTCKRARIRSFKGTRIIRRGSETLMARLSSGASEGSAFRADEGTRMSSPLLLEMCAGDLELKSKVLDGLADGILAHTPDGTLLYFNPAAAAMHGYSIEEFAGLEKFGWIAGAARETISERFSALLESGHVGFESFGHAADGSHFRAEVHARMLSLPRIGQVCVSIVRDITERAVEHDAIKHLAFHDTLTGLANRVKLHEQLRKAMANAERHADIVGIVYIDLDDFKPVNDTFGHAAGDVALTTVADRLVEIVRENDTVTRMGGDEFLVLFPRLADRDDLRLLGRKIQECIAKPIPVGDHTARISATVGLATYHPGETAEEFISRADHAMYRSRSCGVAGWDGFGAED